LSRAVWVLWSVAPSRRGGTASPGPFANVLPVAAFMLPTACASARAKTRIGARDGFSGIRRHPQGVPVLTASERVRGCGPAGRPSGVLGRPADFGCDETRSISARACESRPEVGALTFGVPGANPRVQIPWDAAPRPFRQPRRSSRRFTRRLRWRLGRPRVSYIQPAAGPQPSLVIGLAPRGVHRRLARNARRRRVAAALSGTSHVVALLATDRAEITSEPRVP
jgi:hypothetical protein